MPKNNPAGAPCEPLTGWSAGLRMRIRRPHPPRSTVRACRRGVGRLRSCRRSDGATGAGPGLTRVLRRDRSRHAHIPPGPQGLSDDD